MYDPNEECKAMIAALKELCQRKNMTPHGLAKKAGLSPSTVYAIWNGTAKPQVATILAVCNALDVKIGDLFDRNGGAALGDITCEEEKLMESYERLSEENKEKFKEYIDVLSEFLDKD